MTLTNYHLNLKNLTDKFIKYQKNNIKNHNEFKEKYKIKFDLLFNDKIKIIKLGIKKNL